MRRLALPLVIVAAVLVAAALAWFTLTRSDRSAASEATTEVREVAPFHRLEVSGRADVVLVEGDRETITVETAAHGQTRVRAEVENGTLYISAGVSRRWWSGLFGRREAAQPRITVAFRSLDSIAVSGTVQLTADRIRAGDLRIAASGGSVLRLDGIDVNAIRIEGTGALKATLAGKAVEQRISISGAAEVRGDKLQSQDAVVEVSGAGSIVVNAAKTLRATISGAGSVEYYGDPDVKQSVSGIGTVKRRAGAPPSGTALAARYWTVSFDGASNVSALKRSRNPVAGSRSA